MARPMVIAVAVLALLILILVVQNSQVVAVRLFFWEFEMSRVVLMLLTGVAGFGCGYLVASIVAARSRQP